MALFEAELIDADGPHLIEGDFAIKKLQFLLMDVFDQVPTYSKILGNRSDRAKPKHVEHCKRKGANKAMCPVHKGKSRPPERRAHSALQPMDNELQNAPLASDGTHIKPPALLTLKARVPTAAQRTPYPLIVHLGAEDYPVSHEMGRFVLNTLQPKSMVKYRRGHGLVSSVIVRLASNKNGTLPCPFLFFNYPGTRLPEDPEKRGSRNWANPLNFLEAASGFEPLCNGFAVRKGTFPGNNS
jgi:hypothetical protein